MFTIFPDLLTFSFFAPTILRIFAGTFFLFAAFTLVARTRRHTAESTPFTWYCILAETVVGVLLLVGAWTQIGAILGFFLSAKLLYFSKKRSHLAPESAGAYILLIGICLSILISSAGALAFDLPL